jgi:hypothetical protein
MAHTEEQIEKFLEMAQEIGVGRTMREMGYPKSYATALRWAKNRGVSVNVDPVLQHVKAFDDLYKTEHMLAVVKEGVLRVYEELTENGSLDPDAQKKLAEAFQKYSNQWLVLQGKANAINETQTKDAPDVELMNLIMLEREKNEAKKAIPAQDKPVSA